MKHRGAKQATRLGESAKPVDFVMRTVRQWGDLLIKIA